VRASIPTVAGEPGVADLKQKLLSCLEAHSHRPATLRRIFKELLHRGVRWQQILGWAAQAGYCNNSIRKLLSEVLIELGIRRRKRGAGPKIPHESELLASYIRQLHGASSVKLARAACRILKAQDTARLGSAVAYPDPG